MKKPVHNPSESVRQQDTRAPITIRAQVVEVVEDTLLVGPSGDHTVGDVVDGMIETLGLHAGKRLGKITIDLTEFSKAFITDRTTPL